MARANIVAAMNDIGELYAMSFRGKDMGNFVLTKDQIAALLRVQIAQEKTIYELEFQLFANKGLILFQSEYGLYSVIASDEASQWRKVPHSVIAKLVRTPDDGGSQPRFVTAMG